MTIQSRPTRQAYTVEPRSLQDLPNEILVKIIQACLPDRSSPQTQPECVTAIVLSARNDAGQFNGSKNAYKLAWEPTWIPNLFLVSTLIKKLAVPVVAGVTACEILELQEGEHLLSSSTALLGDPKLRLDVFPTYVSQQCKSLLILQSRTDVLMTTPRLDLTEFPELRSLSLKTLEMYQAFQKFEAWLRKLPVGEPRRSIVNNWCCVVDPRRCTTTATRCASLAVYMSMVSHVLQVGRPGSKVPPAQRAFMLPVFRGLLFELAENILFPETWTSKPETVKVLFADRYDAPRVSESAP